MDFKIANLVPAGSDRKVSAFLEPDGDLNIRTAEHEGSDTLIIQSGNRHNLPWMRSLAPFDDLLAAARERGAVKVWYEGDTIELSLTF